VTADSMSEAGKHLRAHRLRRLAQVHTHPSDWTGHSDWDDSMAYSQQPGAISVVLPNFGRGTPTLAAAGVYIRTGAEWHRVPPHEVPQYLRAVPSSLDFRHIGDDNDRSSIKSARRRPWWTFPTIFKHKTG
jgi:hypothetical protein